MRILFYLCLLLPSLGFTQISFEDVAPDVGLDWTGKSFGASWADVTGDGLPDLFMQCHSNFFDAFFNDDLPRYYFSTETGFEQQPVLDEVSETDWHGGMMFDLDNDGDLDHLSVTGGSSANIFFINDNGDFSYVNQAVEYGLDNDGGVGRSPSVIDANNDGFLDVLLNDLDHGSDDGGPKLLISDMGQSFTDSTEEYALDWPQSTFSVSTDMLGNGNYNVIYLRGKAVITTLEEGQFVENLQFPPNKVFDFAADDFNGDLLPDIFLSRAAKADVFESINPNFIRGYVSYNSTDDVKEVIFSTNSDTPTLTIFPRNTSTNYLVVAGNSISEYIEGATETIQLNATLNGFNGIPAIEDTLTSPHVYIGFDENENHWVLRFSSGLSGTTELGIEIESTELGMVSTSGIADEMLPDQLYLNEGNYSFNPVLQNLLEESDNSVSVTTADFDNDMDIDIYVVRTSYASNKTNILYENVNNESFLRHEGAWGAAGDGSGIGETVNSVDFNNDGFMDIYVTNGASTFFLDDAAVNLYQNSGNSNNWIKLVLKGIVSNNAGLHAKALVYAGGIAQLRFQDGGFHRYSQDDNRLHFGLGQNDVVDSIVIDWPSGIHQVLEAVDVNQILTIEEDLTSGTEEQRSLENLIKVYPNPTEGYLRIDCGIAKPIEVRVYDVQGKLVMTEANHISKNSIELFISETPGFYTIDIFTEAGAVRKKIVVI
jgi:hypothetical protein